VADPTGGLAKTGQAAEIIQVAADQPGHDDHLNSEVRENEEARTMGGFSAICG